MKKSNRIVTMLKWSMEDMIKDMILDAGDNSFHKLKNYFGFTVALSPNTDGKMAINVAKDWISKYYKHMDKLYSNENDKSIKNKEFFFKLDKDTYAWVTTGSKIRNFRAMLKTSLVEAAVFGSMNNNNNSRQNEDDFVTKFLCNPENINIYIFGKKAMKYLNELNKALKAITNEVLYNYNVTGATDTNRDGSQRETVNVLMSSMKTRKIDTLYFDGDVKDQIISHIDNFLNSEKIYTDKDLPFKTGIMLYGEPGTGKSSLATAIATYYKSSLVVIDMTTFEGLDAIQLKQSIDADDLRYVILLEDIDTMYKSLNREDGDELDKSTKKTINKLLQFLDSPTNSPTNVIFLATTNHIEMLDEALLRTGRFDLKINVSSICKETAIEMAKSFNLTDKSVESIMNEIEKKERGTVGEKKIGFPVNQAYLQGLILKYIKIETLNKNGVKIDNPEDISDLDKEIEIPEEKPEEEVKGEDFEENGGLPKAVARLENYFFNT